LLLKRVPETETILAFVAFSVGSLLLGEQFLHQHLRVALRSVTFRADVIAQPLYSLSASSKMCVDVVRKNHLLFLGDTPPKIHTYLSMTFVLAGELNPHAMPALQGVEVSRVPP